VSFGRPRFTSKNCCIIGVSLGASAGMGSDGEWNHEIHEIHEKIPGVCLGPRDPCRVGCG
jgi:hypothetical protein